MLLNVHKYTSVHWLAIVILKSNLTTQCVQSYIQQKFHSAQSRANRWNVCARVLVNSANISWYMDYRMKIVFRNGLTALYSQFEPVLRLQSACACAQRFVRMSEAELVQISICNKTNDLFHLYFGFMDIVITQQND